MSLEKPIEELKLSWADHWDDLRKMVMRCGGILFLMCILVGVFLPQVAKALLAPLHTALEGKPELLQGLVTTSPMGVFSVLIELCLLGGLGLSLPFMVYFLSQFISPALTAREKRFLWPSMLAALGLFLLGGAISYFWILPTSLQVAIGFNDLLGFELIWSAPHYYGLVVWMTLGIGLCFEFPLLLMLLVALQVISVSTLKAYRRHSLILILILAALITPGGDPLTLFLLAAPLYGLFEVTLWLANYLFSRKAIDEA